MLGDSYVPLMLAPNVGLSGLKEHIAEVDGNASGEARA